MNIRQDLINRSKAKDRFAQKELYLVLLPYLGAVVRRYLFDKSYEKDILQDAFVKIFKSIDQYDSGKGVFHKWAVRVVINTCLSHNTRKAPAIVEELNEKIYDIPTIPVPYDKISNEKLLEILKKMPESYFEVFNLFVIDDFDHKEIGKMLNITEQLSRKRLSRGKEWLRKYFNDQKGISSRKLIRNFFLN